MIGLIVHWPQEASTETVNTSNSMEVCLLGMACLIGIIRYSSSQNKIP